MDSNKSKDDVSKQELSILSKALAKSVEYSRQSRYIWIALIAGFLIGAGVATTIVIMTASDKKIITGGEILLRRSHETLKTVIQIQSQVDKLTDTLKTVSETKQEDNKPVSAPTSKMPPSGGKLAATPVIKQTIKKNTRTYLELNRYTVYLHYNRTKHKDTIRDLAHYLQSKGYTVPDIERVADKKRDIRYFHRRDRDGALLLKKHVNDFMSQYPDMKDIDLELRNLGAAYPRASKGSLELWIYL
ncbi:MAG: hypothetical protein JXC33_05880 [Deltaproteobacteria bacterium]|nr:hypothetical protein [Deltaproteobacteria bacterium]